ncbi:hypothetical protein [Vreelandella nigrificans]|uniref:Protein containing Six-hairpin glycosidase-like domain protein n=1 Tax=Vreelandella nigrificans TaxID=2042704 RepID=A0A2A4HHD6_9GAMM|nr:hypothetical protein [Halomonas nigrificans]PCF93605.1 hypothetical protein CPA45_21565 [Halomonas nigrificans]
MLSEYELFESGRCKDGQHPLTALVREFLGSDGDKRSLEGVDISLKELLSLIPKEHQDGVAIVIYQPGLKRILVARRRGELVDNLKRALTVVKNHARFGDFDIDKARIQIDFFGIYRERVKLNELVFGQIHDNRFEFGVDGLIIRKEGKSRFFLPGDGYVRSIYARKQLVQYIRRLTKGMELESSEIEQIRSTSIVSYEKNWLRLYRGHPVRSRTSMEDVERTCERAIDHIVKYHRDDHRFLYYYDAAADTERNHEHPKRDPVNNPYYNDLRHAGGVVTLMLAYQNGRQELKPLIDDMMVFIVDNLVSYKTPNGQVGRYVYYNRKSKLGGSGLALYAFSLYQSVFNDDRFASIAQEVFNHLLEQITNTGEFIYYNIYLDKEVAVQDNENYFSFFYPGEALIGLATFLKYVGVEGERREYAIEKVKHALHFLLVERPITHASHYSSLPSDAWLMGAINELWDMPEFQEKMYSDFVFSDADKMVEQMYAKEDALFPDYVGAFYYQYGDLPYPDGARLEGLVAALALAMKMAEGERALHYAAALVRATRATMLLANSPESLYFAPNPEKSLGGIRFKLTRHWFRIDTIQHVVCYYYRFIGLYEKLLKDGKRFKDEFDNDGVESRDLAIS